jgi:thioredoxin-related protein
MKFPFVLLVLGLMTASICCTAQTTTAPAAEELTWYTDLAKAREASTASNKPIFGFFTGSDWCGWCHKLQADVFAKPAFKTWAKENVILLELDFPRRKQLPAELAKQNQELQQAFQVRGYPTIWMFYATFNTDTKQTNLSALGSVGYPMGAVQGKEEVKFLSDANAVLETGKK